MVRRDEKELESLQGQAIYRVSSERRHPDQDRLMSEPDNIVLIYLRRIDEKADRLIDDARDLKAGMTHVEEGVAGVHRRLDRLELRVDRIERRFDLQDAHP